MFYSDGITKAIRQYFNEKEYTYNFDEGRGMFRLGFVINNSMVKSIDVKMIVRREDFILIATLPIGPNKERIPLISEYLTRANWGMSSGGFELDYDDGQINYKVGFMCDEGSAETCLERAFCVMLHSIEVYGDGIVNLSVGISNNPKAECEYADSISEKRQKDISRIMKKLLLEKFMRIHDNSDIENMPSCDCDPMDTVDVRNEDYSYCSDSDTNISMDPSFELLLRLFSEKDDDNKTDD